MKTRKCYETHKNCNDAFCNVYLDKISLKLTGKIYRQLPDDGAAQDFVMGEYEKAVA